MIRAAWAFPEAALLAMVQDGHAEVYTEQLQ